MGKIKNVSLWKHTCGYVFLKNSIGMSKEMSNHSMKDLEYLTDQILLKIKQVSKTT